MTSLSEDVFAVGRVRRETRLLEDVFAGVHVRRDVFIGTWKSFFYYQKANSGYAPLTPPPPLPTVTVTTVTKPMGPETFCNSGNIDLL